MRRPVQRTTRRAQFSAASAAPAPDPTTSGLGAASRDRWNGAGGVALTVNGANFHALATVYVDGVAVATAFVSSTELTATVPNTVYWEAGAKSVTVQNPSGSPSNAQVYTVSQPSYLHAEYRADAGRTMNGATVQVLADQSGKGDANRNLSQLTAAAQPTYVASEATYNNREALTFDGGDWMQSGTWTSPPVQPRRVYFVGHASSAGVCYLFAGTSAQERILFKNSGTQIGVNAGTQVISSVWNASAKAVFSCEYNGAATKLYLNAKTAAATISAGALNAVGMTLFANRLGASISTGVFAHCLEIDSATASVAQQDEIMDYLGSRYAESIGA
jgi:hypothetical protein